MKALVIATLLVLAAGGVAAQEESSVVELWTCELKDGKTIEEGARASHSSVEKRQFRICPSAVSRNRLQSPQNG